MADHPILFSAPMVRALLDGRKTQTRRVLKQPVGELLSVKSTPTGWYCVFDQEACRETGSEFFPPRYCVGDRLYVREHWRTTQAFEDLSPSQMSADSTRIKFLADGFIDHRGVNLAHFHDGRYRQGMHMPRWASRLTLPVTEVRVQRLQDISEEDAIAEGLIRMPNASSLAVEMGCNWGYEGDNRYGSPVSAYACLWDSINADRAGGAYAWANNPWVTATTFSVVKGNIDEVKS